MSYVMIEAESEIVKFEAQFTHQFKGVLHQIELMFAFDKGLIKFRFRLGFYYFNSPALAKGRPAIRVGL